MFSLSGACWPTPNQQVVSSKAKQHSRALPHRTSCAPYRTRPNFFLNIILFYFPGNADRDNLAMALAPGQTEIQQEFPCQEARFILEDALRCWALLLPVWPGTGSPPAISIKVQPAVGQSSLKIALYKLLAASHALTTRPASCCMHC